VHDRRRELASDLGIGVGQVAATLRPLLAGQAVGNWRGPDDQYYDVQVRLSRADRARDCAKKPIYVRGTGEGTEHVSVTNMKKLTFSEATRISGERAFAMAGVSHRDINHLMFYDAFTSGPPIMLESLGFAKPGEGVHFFDEGRSTPGGSLPINTNGGGLSYTHTGMYGIFPIIEATRQLRGECGARQVPGVKLSLVNGMGGMLSAAGTLVLSNETGS
jgi:acetyl-CoA acetyltransferase